MRAVAGLLFALLWAIPAQAQTSEPFFGCPTNQTLETAPDPRLGAPLTRGAPQRLVVRCVSVGLPVRPQCPAGMRPVPMLGTDPCGPAGNGTVTDGTSNTIMIGETGSSTGDGNVRSTATDGTSNTLMVGETSHGSTATQMGDGSVRTVAPASPPPSAGLTTGKGSGTITTAPTNAAPIVPRCTAPAQLTIDSGGPADTCTTRAITPPTAAVSVPIR